MKSTFYFLYEILNGYSLLLFIECISFMLKSIMLFGIVSYRSCSQKVSLPWKLLIIILISSLIISFSWIGTLFRALFYPSFDPRITLFIIRLAWAAQVTLYQSLVLLIEALLSKNYKLPWYQKICICFNSIIIGFICYVAFFNYNECQSRVIFAYNMLSFISQYVFLMIIPILCYYSIQIRKKLLPKLLKKQFHFLQLFLSGYIIADFIQI